MPTRRTRTAEEFVRELAADSEYQARVAAQSEARQMLAAACAADEASLVADLRDAGHVLESVFDFLPGGGAPASAIPMLVAHLNQPHHPCIWEGIVRALSTPTARAEALEPLRAAYRTEGDPERRWVVANAVGSMARFSEVQDLPGIAEHRPLFRQSRKPAHAPPAS
jgi:hypothetical protein